MLKNMSKGAQRVKLTKSTRTTKSHVYSPSPLIQKLNPLRWLLWILSRNSHRQEGTTPYSPSPTTTAPKQRCLSPATKPSLVKESRNCTCVTHTPTMASPTD